LRKNFRFPVKKKNQELTSKTSIYLTKLIWFFIEYLENNYRRYLTFLFFSSTNT